MSDWQAYGEAVREMAAKIAEGDEISPRYRQWPSWSSIGNRDNESELVKLTGNLAFAIRTMPLPEPPDASSNLAAEMLAALKLAAIRLEILTARMRGCHEVTGQHELLGEAEAFYVEAHTVIAKARAAGINPEAPSPTSSAPASSPEPR